MIGTVVLRSSLFLQLHDLDCLLLELSFALVPSCINAALRGRILSPSFEEHWKSNVSVNMFHAVTT